MAVVIGVCLVGALLLVRRFPGYAAALVVLGVGGCTVAYVVAPSGLRETVASKGREEASAWSAGPEIPTNGNYINDQPLPSEELMGRRVEHRCPWRTSSSPPPEVPFLWGGDGVYTYESSVCWAAVHAGLINAGDRARLVVQLVPPLPHYPGSSQNGVTSLEWIPTPEENNPFAYVFVEE